MDIDYSDLADEGWNQDSEEDSEPLAELSQCHRADSTSAFKLAGFDYQGLSTNFIIDNEDMPDLERATSREVEPDTSFYLASPTNNSISITPGGQKSQAELDPVPASLHLPDDKKLNDLKSQLVQSYHSFFERHSHLLQQLPKTVKQGVGSFQKLLFLEQRKDYLYKKLFRDFKRLLKYAKSNILDKYLDSKPKLGYFNLSDLEKLQQFKEIRKIFNENIQVCDLIVKFKGKLTVGTFKEFLAEPVIGKLYTLFIALVFSFVNTNDVERVRALLNAQKCFTESSEMREVMHEYLGLMIFLL